MRVVGPTAHGHEIAAAEIAARVEAAFAERGRADIALSGGTTPGPMFVALAASFGDAIPPSALHVWQVDERIVAADDDRRNWRAIDEALVAPVGCVAHPMPVEADDADSAAAAYGAGLPPRFDAVHLGLGDDGHTASLVPGDPVLAVDDRFVAVTDRYQGTRRMTLTYPALNRARLAVFLVGVAKRAAVDRLLAGDEAIPATRVRAAEMVVVVVGDDGSWAPADAGARP